MILLVNIVPIPLAIFTLAEKLMQFFDECLGKHIFFSRITSTDDHAQ